MPVQIFGGSHADRTLLDVLDLLEEPGVVPLPQGQNLLRRLRCINKLALHDHREGGVEGQALHKHVVALHCALQRLAQGSSIGAVRQVQPHERLRWDDAKGGSHQDAVGAVTPRQGVKELLVTRLGDLLHLSGAGHHLIRMAYLIEHAILPGGGLNTAAHQEPSNCEVVQLRHTRHGVATPQQKMRQLHHAQAGLHHYQALLHIHLNDVLERASVDLLLPRSNDPRADPFPVWP
mmetsp:Transcript_38794/g.92724  ORF Transcript_38794/g.92724 Transcript_38794/m.92724 type:complete len:234 (-) Transcript_38794:321-1022(-)